MDNNILGPVSNNIFGGLSGILGGMSGGQTDLQGNFKDAFSKDNRLNTILSMMGPVGWYAGLTKSMYDKAGDQMAKGDELVDKQIGDLGSWYKRESGTPFLQTEAAASALRQLQGTLSDVLVGQQNNAVTGGATNEAQLAGRKEATKQYGDAVNKLVGYGTDRKDQLARDYQYRLGQWLQAKLGQHTARAQNYSTAGQNLIQAPFDLLQTGIGAFGALSGGGGGLGALAGKIA